MKLSPAKTSVDQMFSPVKSFTPQLPLRFPDEVIHHKVTLPRKKRLVTYQSIRSDKPYGVSRSYRVLSKAVFLRKYGLVREALAGPLGLTVSQREVVLRLLRLWAYYGQVYPKASQIAELPGCSKATFWRTIRLLEERGLLQVVNRYVLRERAQISNLYLLHHLLIVIARYLAEHGTRCLEKWLGPYLLLPGKVFWGSLVPSLGIRAAPSGSAGALSAAS